MHIVRNGKLNQWKRPLFMAVLLICVLTGSVAFTADADDANGVLRSRA